MKRRSGMNAGRYGEGGGEKGGKGPAEVAKL